MQCLLIALLKLIYSLSNYETTRVSVQLYQTDNRLAATTGLDWGGGGGGGTTIKCSVLYAV